MPTKRPKPPSLFAMSRSKGTPAITSIHAVNVHSRSSSNSSSTARSSNDPGQGSPEPHDAKSGEPLSAAQDTAPEDRCTISIDEVPVTTARKPYVSAHKTGLVNAGTARANVAASAESPDGTTEGDWAKKHAHQTVLQQHVLYWDRDSDGIIWPSDTYAGIRAWGWSLPLTLLVVFIINFNLSYPTVPGLLPDPFFRIYIKNLHKDKHGSDSETFDHEGRFRPQQFEDLFEKYDEGRKGGLDVWDLSRVVRGQRNVFDIFGILASIFEWTATYLLLWPEDGVMRKEDIRCVYDGSIFQRKADDYARAKVKRKAKE